MNEWSDKLNKFNIFFITPDVKRGIGFEDLLPNYHIICSYWDALIPVLRKQGADIFCLAEISKMVPNNTGQLLSDRNVLSFIQKNSSVIPYIMFFKPSIKIDIFCQKTGFGVVGNSSRLNELFENKVKSYTLLHKYFPSYLIPGETGQLGRLNYKDLFSRYGSPFVIQFGRGWAGKTTFFINNKKDFEAVQARYLYTEVRINKKIDGLTVLNNCCIYQDYIMVSPPALQISGIKILHPNPSVTCGRQWPVKFLDKKQIETINDISEKIGKLMQQKKYQGYFGLDFLAEKKSGKVYLSEINARLTASTAFYTKLERGLGRIPLLGYHLASFLHLGLPETQKTESLTGSQLIIRKDSEIKLDFVSRDLGVYQVQKMRLKFGSENYHPEKLKPNEFILIKEYLEREERGRIETIEEIITVPMRLTKQFENLIRGRLRAD